MSSPASSSRLLSPAHREHHQQHHHHRCHGNHHTASSAKGASSGPISVASSLHFSLLGSLSGVSISSIQQRITEKNFLDYFSLSVSSSLSALQSRVNLAVSGVCSAASQFSRYPGDPWTASPFDISTVSSSLPSSRSGSGGEPSSATITGSGTPTMEMGDASPPPPPSPPAVPFGSMHPL